ncbi:BREX system serine/threonine kinase PglW [Amycolatopsis cihanbeyliensis]|uniref:Serine/threonine protein kinase n=1 Tax=Amycolatopsis cihanbeyliensis TaxID=1128664 RepID=A0A542DLY0_AMYCI|nr:BREX system serine/threonine kinase PglW [Amycolatopsis cihanbeyliensis]TQJ04106.1 serine/threonine protein kinase [Amycolatopsis cihanbeyliensis]
MAADPEPGPPRSQRWIQREPSQFTWEQDGLDFVKKQLPNAEPYRAWATFSFVAASGRVNECDLLIAVPGGLYLVELKAHPGRVTNNGSTWRVKDPNDGRIRTLDNPLALTDLKAKELKGQLTRAAQKAGKNVRIPWIQPAVFLTDPGLKSELDEFQQPNVYARHARSGLPRIWEDLLARPPQRESHRITAEFSARILPQLLKTIGITASNAHLKFGDHWKLAPRPLDAGPFWEDRLAKRDDGHIKEEGRVRLYLVREGTTESDREKAKRAALREYQVLQGISHRGIVQAVQFREHQGLPAILFRHAESDLRLDTYLAAFGANVGPDTRLDLVRQLAEAIRYAHNRSLYHRALSPRSIYVAAREDGSNPVLRLIDWQTAARDFETTNLRSIGDSSLDGAFIEDTAQCYLAPETDQPYPDPVDLDVFGLGAVAYLILSGRNPAANRAELKERLSTDDGLHVTAVDDTLPAELDALIHRATSPDVAHRLDSADTFLRELDGAERETAPPRPASTTEIDPLTAVVGQELHDGWEVAKVLGTGATARALLVERLVEDERGEPEVEQRVLKVALDDEKADRLHAENKALHLVGGGYVVQRLGGPDSLGGRTVLVLEFAGDVSLARRLHDEGRLTYHELERFSRDLFSALDQLAAKGVRHRDIKPANFGIFQRADRSKQLKLFDFSLHDAPASDVSAGTRGYLDPFLGSLRRPRFDEQAEWYAAAVTLYEMASGERPKWGDELTAPDMGADDLPRIDSELFEPALRDGLTRFFESALHRDTDRRFTTLRRMEDAWRAVFSEADATAPPTTQATVDGSTSETDLSEARDIAANAAQLDTPLEAAGLSPRAVSVANEHGATTVEELLSVRLHVIARARGAGSLTRKELNRRHKQWTARLLRAASSTAHPEPAEAAGEQAEPTRLSIEQLVEYLEPAPARKNSYRPTIERLALGLPDSGGTPTPLGAWPTQSRIAGHLKVSQPTVSRHFVDAIKSWRAAEWLEPVRRELVGIVEELGRIATAPEVAAEFRARHGSVRGDQRRALNEALAVVRAAVEAELAPGEDEEQAEPRLAVQRKNDTMLIAAESLEGSAAPTPSELGDYAVALGRKADRLADQEPLPSAATVLRDLRAVGVPDGMRPLADTRLVALAAAMSQRAAASRRLELYHRDLRLDRALRISQAAVGVRDAGISRENLLARVRARFPEIELGDPSYIEVERALAAAGSKLTYGPTTGRFTPPEQPWRRMLSSSSSHLSSIDPDAAATGRDPVELQSARLAESVDRGGFVAITVKAKDLPGTARLLAERFGVLDVDLGRLFLTELRELVAEKQQDWAKVLAADARISASTAVPRGLASYVSLTWQRVRQRLLERVTDAGPRTVVFLHDAGLLGRYAEAGGHALLVELQRAARLPDEQPHGLWLLCPAEAPNDSPRLLGEQVEVLPDDRMVALMSQFLAQLRPSDAA